MVRQLLNHIQRNNLCKTSDKILLAVSGGLDSMVMLHLFQEAGFSVGVVHCNFQLRHEESAGDEAFVRNTCLLLEIPFHVKRFDTGAIAEENGLSIQVLAREQRYAFFEEVAAEFQYSHIATAHHLNDNLETVLLHLVRGTGFDGICGIPVKNGNVIRPMLFATRQQLQDYAQQHRLLWREDSSNETDDYQRNFLRHHVIPKLNEINPNLERTFQSSTERITGAAGLLKKYLGQIKFELVKETEDTIHIDIKRLKRYSFPEVLLWELLKDSGFNYDQCKLIVQDHQPGKRFYSPKYRLTVDREFYILTKLKDSIAFFEISIREEETQVDGVHGMLRLQYEDVEDFHLNKEATIAQVDADKIQFPLSWRNWRAGDVMIPLGMQQPKKISDILIDKKISITDKEKISVLISSGEILWLVGHRIHDGYKITEKTKRVLVIEYFDKMP